MHVVATAGHVDHGKSTLVRALTGSDPDRLAEERRRGLSIELGYAWTSLSGVGEVAFVDVPGHERFVSTMLAGVAPVPAVLLVVAADDPWMPQAAEHLAALDALGVRHGVVAVTRCDLADPAAATRTSTAELSQTSLAGAPVVPVSSATGAGLSELRAALVATLRSVPAPAPGADVRMWVDRRFAVRGAGTVVTGTVPAGRVVVGDTLVVAAGAVGAGGSVRVRGMEALGSPVPSVDGPARVALNLAGAATAAVQRGSALLTPGAWQTTDLVDVRLAGGTRGAGGPGPVRDTGPPARPVLHLGSTSVQVHARPLSDDLVRLRLPVPLPLRVGDRAVLRDPGSRRLWALTVLDPAPPPLRRRGAAAARAASLEEHGCSRGPAAEVARRGVVHRDLLRRVIGPAGAAPPGSGVLSVGPWLVSRPRAAELARAIEGLTTEHQRRYPLDRGLSAVTLAERLGLPSADIVPAVLPAGVTLVGGRVTAGHAATLPVGLEDALVRLERDLDAQPFAAPTADRLRELGLDARAVAAAARAGRVLRLAPGVVLLAGADRAAVQRLRPLPQPFTVSQARATLCTSRRVALPLLDHLDARGWTRRLPDDRRTVV